MFFLSFAPRVSVGCGCGVDYATTPDSEKDFFCLPPEGATPFSMFHERSTEGNFFWVKEG